MKLEEGGRILRGIAVPFDDEGAVVVERGQLVRERFDQQSITELPVGVPLRVGHDQKLPPVGKVVEAENRAYGLVIAARLAVSDAELESWRARWAEGLVQGLSIGFVQASSRSQIWVKPTRRGELPVLIRRGVTIREVSLVHEPAYAGARITALSRRTGREARRHNESQRLIAEALATTAQASRLLAARSCRRG